MNISKTKVIKRDGTKDSLDVQQIHNECEEMCDGYANVSVSDIEMYANLNFTGEQTEYTTKEIQSVIIDSAVDRIDVDHPNYQYVAAKGLVRDLRKEVFKTIDLDSINFIDYIKKMVHNKFYHPIYLEAYSETELKTIGKLLRHKRDYNFAYAGIKQVKDKNLLKDQETGEIYESPQMLYMFISMFMFIKYPKDIRLTYVKQFYDCISKFKINQPSPFLSNLRTLVEQYASCCLIDFGDNLQSIGYSDYVAFIYTALGSGIGENWGRVRPVGEKARNGKVIATGLIPYLKKAEATVKSNTQNGTRGGSATVNVPFWHSEIEDIIMLKNNRGTEDNRVRKLDYCIQFSNLFYERFKAKEDITLFPVNRVPDLYEAFGTDKFDELYLKYEEKAKNSKKFRHKRISARTFFSNFLTERTETGRLYVMNMENANYHSSFQETLYMTNLCTEIILPTKPLIDPYDTDAEIGICILAALNVGEIKHDEDLENCCEMTVRALDELIDLQEYPFKAAELSTKRRRSLGIGITNLAYFIAKKKARYSDNSALYIVDELMEKIQYYLLKASNRLAIEKGPCEYFHKTKYALGILPIDTYNKNVDKICDRPLSMDWETLRQDILTHGLRNSALTAIAPTESSSVVTNATNGIEPITSLLTIKKNKQNTLRQLAPECDKLDYESAFDMPNNIGYINIIAVLQKYIDQSISSTLYYDPSKFGGELPLSIIAKEVLYANEMGLKTLYYHKTRDGNKQNDSETQNLGCESGACSI